MALADADMARRQVAAVMRDVRDHVLYCANRAPAHKVYDLDKPPLLRAISPLAEGADRLVADEALRCGFQLDVTLPFGRASYEATFTQAAQQRAASLADFARLHDAAGPRVLTLDGDRGNENDRHRSYEAVGRLVVRNCDLLIAIWDDTAAAGRGGTADIVQYALRAGVPVWWIHAADDVPARWLQDILDLPRFGFAAVAARTPARDALREYIERVILPPEPVDTESSGLWERAISCLRCAVGIEADPLLTFLAETGRPNLQCWNVHPNVSRFIRRYGRRHQERREAGKGRSPVRHVAEPARPAPVVQETRLGWHRKVGSALSWPLRRNKETTSSSMPAALSRTYQHRYRTSYLAVLFFGAVALFSAVLGLAFQWAETTAMFFELATLLAILLLVVANEVAGWHERYLSYRMFAELLRLSRHLHALGWSLSGSRINNLARGTQRNWVAWFFAACARAEPMVATAFTATQLVRLKRHLIKGLIDEQIGFHRDRHNECRGTAHLLGNAGRWFFLATVVLVVARVGVWGCGASELASKYPALCCALLPAAAAALFGFRAYEEYEVLAQQSERMEDALRRARSHVRRVRIKNRPLASQMLGVELNDVTTLMLSDVEGWAQLFRMKAVEA